MYTPESFHVVVTDINHHVRNFLQRELENEGYTVYSIKTGRLTDELLCSSAPLDVIILDPELFPCFDKTFVEDITRRHPYLHIIIHTYADSINGFLPGNNIHLVEKNGQSIRSLKAIISTCFNVSRRKKAS